MFRELFERNFSERKVIMIRGGQADTLDTLPPSTNPPTPGSFPVSESINTVIICRLNQLKLTKCTTQCLLTDELKRSKPFLSKMIKQMLGITAF